MKYIASTGDITGQSLYNGNISNSTLALSAFNSGATVGYTYHYDQLNKLKKTRQHTGISGTSWDKNSITLNYQENAVYDGNGNILTYGRNGAYPTAQTIDSLTYNYNKDAHGRLTNNQLNYIHDAIANSNYSGDLTNQSPNNYAYDPTGNLIQDTNAGITNIKWSVYGKIDTITKGANNIIYTYNPAGQRVTKTAGGLITYYIRDAQGNPLALYDNAGSDINWKEQQLYGSSRLGLWQPNVKLGTDSAIVSWDTVGRKQYELTNHLGNVLTTISDKRLQHASGSSIDYFTSDITTAQDYYPFGMLQPERQYTTVNPYRYGFNGKENDNEAKGVGNQQDYGMRIYDPRVGRFLSVDLIERDYPALTPYQISSNNPMTFIDIDGLEKGKPKGQENPLTYFKRVMDNIQAGIEEQYHNLEAAALRLDTKEGNAAVDKAVVNAMRNPEKTIKNITQNVNKQANQAVDDGLTFLNLTATGQNKKSSDFLGKKLAEYGPLFLIPEEKEFELLEGETFAVRPQKITALGSSQGQWKTLRDAGLLSDFKVLKIDDSKLINIDFSTKAGRDMFWNTYNKPFLDEAVRKGQPFKLIDVPSPQNIFYYDKNGVRQGLNFYGKELEYLIKEKKYIIKGDILTPSKK